MCNAQCAHWQFAKWGGGDQIGQTYQSQDLYLGGAKSRVCKRMASKLCKFKTRPPSVQFTSFEKPPRYSNVASDILIDSFEL